MQTLASPKISPFCVVERHHLLTVLMELSCLVGFFISRDNELGEIKDVVPSGGGVTPHSVMISSQVPVGGCGVEVDRIFV